MRVATVPVLAATVVSLSLSAAAAPAAQACYSSPDGAVETHYRYLSNHKFRKAWSCLSTQTRGEFGGYSTWRRGYRGFVRVVTFSKRLTDQGAGLADVSLRFTTCSRRSGSYRLERFSGYWSAVDGYAGWRLISPNIKRRSSRAVSSCAP